MSNNITENEQIAQGIVSALDFTHALTGLGGGAIVLIILGLVGRGILSKAQEGLATKEDLEALEKYVMRIDKKEQKTRGAVMKIAGHIDIDLPELAD